VVSCLCRAALAVAYQKAPFLGSARRESRSLLAASKERATPQCAEMDLLPKLANTRAPASLLGLAMQAAWLRPRAWQASRFGSNVLVAH